MAVELPYELRKSERTATELIDQFGIQSPEDIRLEDIAYALGIRVIVSKLEKAAARLVRYADHAVVRISDQERNEGRMRFSLAHEIGHFLLHEKSGPLHQCTEQDMLTWESNVNPEVEANVFASELLMPSQMIIPYSQVSPVDLSRAQKICDDFSVSLTAACVRFVRFSSEMCAVVFSQQGLVKWWKGSEEFWPFINVRKPLDPETLAYDFFTKGKTYKNAEGVAPEAWLDSDRLGDIDEVIEHSFGSARLGFTLSLLWIES